MSKAADFLRLTNPAGDEAFGPHGSSVAEERHVERGLQRGMLAAAVQGGELTLEQALERLAASDQRRMAEAEADMAWTERAESKPMRGQA